MVLKRPQRINFPALEDRHLGDPSFPLRASADSGLPVEFVLLSGPAVIQGDEVAVTGRGKITIAATQPGNHAYAPADTVARSLTVKDVKRNRLLLLAALPLAAMIAVAAIVIWKMRHQETVQPTLASLTISPAAGPSPDMVRVELGNAPAGSRVAYTLDGTEPTDQATPYRDPINLTQTATVKARALGKARNPVQP